VREPSRARRVVGREGGREEGGEEEGGRRACRAVVRR